MNLIKVLTSTKLKPPTLEDISSLDSSLDVRSEQIHNIQINSTVLDRPNFDSHNPERNSYDLENNLQIQSTNYQPNIEKIDGIPHNIEKINGIPQNIEKIDEILENIEKIDEITQNIKNIHEISENIQFNQQNNLENESIRLYTEIEESKSNLMIGN